MTSYSSTDMDTGDTDEEYMRRRHRQTYGEQITQRDMQYAGIGSDRSERMPITHKRELRSVVTIPKINMDSTGHEIVGDTYTAVRDYGSQATRRDESQYERSRIDARGQNRKDRRLHSREKDKKKRSTDSKLIKKKSHRRLDTSSDSDDDSEEELRGAVGGRNRRTQRKQTWNMTDEETGDQQIRKREREDKMGKKLNSSKKTTSQQAMKARCYDGNSPWESFLIQFEICSDYNGWTDEQKKAQLQCCLTGKAAQVLFDTAMEGISTYKQLVEKLRARFSSSSHRERFVEELRSRRRRPGESLTDLHADIRRLFALAYASKVMDADVSEAIARDYFIASLNDPDLEIRVKERDPIGLEDALKAAIRAETHLKAYEQAAERNERDRQNRQRREEHRTRQIRETDCACNKTGESDNAKLMQRILEQMAACQKQTEDLSKEVGKMRLLSEQTIASQAYKSAEVATATVESRPVVRTERRQCNMCGEIGHLQGMCPNKYRSATGNSNTRNCYNCGLPGHISRTCPEKSKTASQENPEVKSSKGIKNADEDKRVYLEVDFETGRHLILLDTGSEITLLPSTLKGYSTIQSTNQRVMAANGTEISIVGVTKVPAKINGVPIEITGYVTQNVDEVIVGIDVLKEWKCVWDFDSSVIQIFGMHIPLKSRPKKNICRRIVLSDDTVIPAHSEMIANGTVVFRDCIRMNPNESWAQMCRQVTQGIYAASAVMPCRATDVPTRLVNTTDEAIELKKGTLIANMVPVEVCSDNDHRGMDTPAVREMNNGKQGTRDASDDVCNNETRRKEERLMAVERMIRTADDSINDEQRERLRDVIFQHIEAFSFSESDIGCTDLIRHKIETGDALPCRQRLRRQPPAHDKVIKEQIDILLQQGAIEPAQSPWASNVVVVKKKDGSFRMCIDYRGVNDVTKKDSYNTVRVDSALDALTGSMWFTTLDLRSSYHQIVVEDNDRDKTAWISRFGQYRYSRMPFGLCNSSATFQRLIDLVLSGIAYVSCLAYIDDIIVFSETINEHFERLSCVLKRIADANLKCRPDKCTFLRPSVEFLGHVVSRDGIAILPKRVEAVATWPRPTSVRELREAIGFMSYYRRLIRDFAKIAQPMTDLLKGRAPTKFIWSDEAEDAFERLKMALTTSPVLAMPTNDGTFVLDTDASQFAIGAVLGQMQNGVECAIAYGSRRLKKTEMNYCTTRRELLAIIHFVRHFRCYLLGRPFIIRTDHAALVWLRKIKEPVGQQARWLEELENYEFSIEHRAGYRHSNADALSRRPHCNRNNSERRCPLCDAEPIHTDGVSRNNRGNGHEYDERESEQDVTNQIEQNSGWDVDNETSDGVQKVNIDATDRDSAENGIDGVSTRERVGLTHLYPECECRAITVTDNRELQTEQEADEDLSWVRSQIMQGTEKPKWCEISGKSAESKALWAQWDRMIVKEGVLMRRYELVSEQGSILQLVIPKNMRKSFVKDIHEGFGGAHLGRTRTEAAIRRRAYWPAWSDTVDMAIRCCAPCARYSREKPPRQVDMTPIMCGEPFETVSIDITGPHPTSYSGHSYILTVQDHFSRWTEAYPLRRHTADAIATQLFENWYSRYGFPLSLLSDLGPEMEGNIMRELCRLAHIDKIRTCAYTPKTNGKLERFHKTLNEMLAKCVCENQKDWPSHLAYVTAAYRATRHETTQFSPNKIIFGRELRVPIDLIYRTPEQYNATQSMNEYVSTVVDRIQKDYELVRRFACRAAETMKTRYDRKVKRGDDLSPGQKVLYYYPRRYVNKSPKWQSVYIGPFTVVKQIDAHRVVIRRHVHNVPIVVGRDKVKIIPDGMCFANDSTKNMVQNDATPRISNHVGGRNDLLEDDPGRIGGKGEFSDDDKRIPHENRPSRRRNKPTYLRDYIVRHIICSSKVEMESVQQRTMVTKKIECSCGNRFTARRGWKRHMRESCPMKNSGAVMMYIPGAKETPSPIDKKSDDHEPIDGSGQRGTAGELSLQDVVDSPANEADNRKTNNMQPSHSNVASVITINTADQEGEQRRMNSSDDKPTVASGVDRGTSTRRSTPSNTTDDEEVSEAEGIAIPEEVNQEHWKEWLAQEPVVNKQSVAQFLKGATDQLPKECKKTILGWLADAINAAVNVERQRVNQLGAANDQLVTAKFCPLIEGTDQIARVRRTRLISSQIDNNSCTNRDGLVTTFDHNQADVRSDAVDVRILSSTDLMNIIDRSVILQPPDNVNAVTLATGDDMEADATDSDADEHSSPESDGECEDESLHEAPDLEQSVAAEQSQELTAKNINDELSLCINIFSVDQQIDVQYCEKALAVEERYRNNEDLTGIARLVLAAFIVGASRHNMVFVKG